MGIISFTTDVAGQINVNPRRVKIVSTDNLATVTAAGYLNTINSEGLAIYKTDIIDMIYGFNTSTNLGTYGEFLPSFGTGNVITLVQFVDPGNVLLPVISGDFAVFNSTTGQIKDAGYLPSNAALTNVVMESGASIIGNLAKYNDVNGTIIDSGLAASGLNVLSASVTLNQAAVQAAYATPFQIVAASANKVIVPVYASIYTNFQTSAFSSGGVAILQYDSTAHGAGTNSLAATIPAVEITAASSQIYNLGGSTASVLTGVTNKGLFFSNATGAFAGGSASSTVVITVSYYLITATV